LHSREKKLLDRFPDKTVSAEDKIKFCKINDQVEMLILVTFEIRIITTLLKNLELTVFRLPKSLQRKKG